jgi:hypothetical protein
MKQAERFQEEISVPEAAKKYDLTPSQITKLARAQKIQARKLGRDWIIAEASLRAYVAQPRKTGRKPRNSQQPQQNVDSEQVLQSSTLQSKQEDLLDVSNWIQQTMDDLQRAVEAGQLSEEGRKLIVAQLAREKQMQELVQRASKDKSVVD